MAKTTEQVFVRTIDSLYVYKPLLSTCFVLLYNFLFMCNAFVFCLKKQDIFLEKAVLILILYHLFILMTPVIIRPCHILYSENYHQLFKH